MTGFDRYPNLFRPIQLGGTLYRNRIFYAPTGLLDLTPECAPTEDYIAYFERKAKGGAAAVNIGECYIDNLGGPQHRYDVIRMKDHKYNYNGLGKLANNISRYGAVPSLELQKPGIASSHDGETLLGPSDGINPYNHNAVCRAMTEEEIYAVINDYSDAALYAKNRGFGMVTIHAGHGWFIQQFYSPMFNHRTDQWGGSVENRARLAVAIIDDIHRKCGKKFPVEIRISGTELCEEGYDLEGGIALAKQLDGHADLIHVSVGNVCIPETAQYTHPTIFGQAGCNVPLAAAIKQNVNTPVATVGGLSDPDELEEIIASGKADIVVMARGLICDPDLPIKARTGREKEIRRCLRCFKCIGEMYTHGRIFCSINPESGKYKEISDAHPLRESKKVLVAGGGMAGMEAAVTAAANGHKVILCEKSDRLGGVLLCETAVPFKKRVGEYIELQKYMIGKAGIEVRLNTPVTPELVNTLQPDALICAIGAVPSLPPIPGIEGKQVVTAERAFAHPEALKGKVVILGAGLSGMELAIYLHGLGVDAVLVEQQGAELGMMNETQAEELKRCGLSVHYEHTVQEITETGVRCTSPEGERFFEADTVVAALGLRPLWDEAIALSNTAGEFYQVGDCRQPRSILDATGEGWTAAMNLGRF